KQSRRRRRSELQVDTLSTCGFAEDRHSIWIAAEGRDVAPDPLESKLLIHEAVVAVKMTLRVNRRMREKPQEPKPIVDGHHDHLSLQHQRRGVKIFRTS